MLMPVLARNVRDRAPTFDSFFPLHPDKEEKNHRDQPDQQSSGDKTWGHKPHVFDTIRLIPDNVIVPRRRQTVRTGPAFLALADISLGACTSLFTSTGLSAFTLCLGVTNSTSSSDRFQGTYLCERVIISSGELLDVYS